METAKTINTLKVHLALNVRNIEKSIEFYRKMLGIEPCKVRTGYAKFDVQNPPLNLTLNQSSFREHGALSHLGIQVASTEDVLAMREQWHKKGLVTRDEMQTNCCYATQDKSWVNDPDGNEWEVFVVLKDNLPESAEHKKPACCAPADVERDAVEKTSCACEAAPEAVGESACCEPQTVKSGIPVNADSDTNTCCAPAPVNLTR